MDNIKIKMEELEAILKLMAKYHVEKLKSDDGCYLEMSPTGWQVNPAKEYLANQEGYGEEELFYSSDY